MHGGAGGADDLALLHRPDLAVFFAHFEQIGRDELVAGTSSALAAASAASALAWSAKTSPSASISTQPPPFSRARRRPAGGWRSASEGRDFGAPWAAEIPRRGDEIKTLTCRSCSFIGTTRNICIIARAGSGHSPRKTRGFMSAPPKPLTPAAAGRRGRRQCPGILRFPDFQLFRRPDRRRLFSRARTRPPVCCSPWRPSGSALPPGRWAG